MIIKKIVKSACIMAVGVFALTVLFFLFLIVDVALGGDYIIINLILTAAAYSALIVLPDRLSVVFNISKTLYYISAVFMPAIAFGSLCIVLEIAGIKASLSAGVGSLALYSVFMAITLAISCAIIIVIRLFMMFRNKHKSK